MKLFYIFLFFILFSCNTFKKEYVCGDRPCLDKKEFNEYFSKNLTIEIVFPKKNERKNINLIRLNTEEKKIKKINLSILKKDEKLRKRKEKERLKAEKLKLKEERKIQKKLKKNRDKKMREIAKISKSNQTDIRIINNQIDNDRRPVNTIEEEKIKNAKSISEQPFYEEKIENSEKIENVKSMCDEIKDCDINKIAEILINKGKSKPFPDIASN